MSTELPAISIILDRLEILYGVQPPPYSSDPLGIILWENVVYLADDSRRRAAFDMLRQNIGLDPASIAAAFDELLLKVTSHGEMAESRIGRLREIAEIALQDFGGDLSSLARLQDAQIHRALKRFPSIGDPGADRIALFCRLIA